MGAAKRIATDRAQGRPVSAELMRAFEPKILPPVPMERKLWVIEAYAKGELPQPKKQGELF